MQSKGILGSAISGVIAIFLALVCIFYISFSVATNHFEKKGEEYAALQAGTADSNSPDYQKAYKNYIDSIGKEKVYLGYTFNEVQRMGVGLGLDLKGGMNVILQVSMPDIIRSMASVENDSTLEKALAATDALIAKHETNDYIGTFCKEYRNVNSQADFSVLFKDAVSRGDNDETVKTKLKKEVNDRVNNSANVLRTRIDQYGVVSPNIQVLKEKDGQILLELPGVKEHERVRHLLQQSASLEFYETYEGTDLQGAFRELENALKAEAPATAAAPKAEAAPADSAATDSAAVAPVDASIAGKSLVALGVMPQGATPVIGQATKAQCDEIFEILASPTAKRILPDNLVVRRTVKPTELETRDPNDTTANAPTNKIELYQLVALKTNHGEPALAGDVVVSASSDFDNFQGNVVSMTMNAEGAKKWARVTRDNIGHAVAIVLDDYVYSYPNVNQAIEGGRSQITGHFTVDEAKDLATVLKSGKMAAKVDIISDMVIGPSLGHAAIKAGFISFIVALVLLMIFMMMYYGIIPGLIANCALILNLFFTFGILASFEAVLTMSGIAGIVLALGMAVDANVLIYERTKEELRNGKNVRTAISDGYSNAFSAIFDSNLTSIITGVILMLYGTGPIKGFATTLIVGIICSFFTAVFLSRLAFAAIAKGKRADRLTFTTAISRKLFQNSHINFLGQRKIGFGIVTAIILIVAASFVFRGLNQGIDFSGGRNYVVKFDKDVNPQELRADLAPEFPNSTLSVITIEGKDQVRISTNYKINEEGEGVEKEITDKLHKVLSSNPKYLPGMSEEEFSTRNEDQGIISSQKVGPTVADDMRTGAIIAVVLSLIAMFLYILLRFRNVAFSVGALCAVAFTAFTIIGFYSLFWGILPFSMEIDQNFIAAILTVIGYQINDTVVVFDRVRENVGLYPKKDFGETINLSINSTLGRTIMTSFTTLLVLLVIFILGGESIRSFIFAMLFGVITGTLSTIYVASPIAWLVDRRRTSKKIAKN
ncbi:MAG: protein translocase subunit SecDF [Muribaculaceae bacterium]|nr:protein translocase subunit SecDF [Muribaculaceae bacterium]